MCILSTFKYRQMIWRRGEGKGGLENKRSEEKESIV
jgi:hypothetical protein